MEKKMKLQVREGKIHLSITHIGRRSTDHLGLTTFCYSKRSCLKTVRCRYGMISFQGLVGIFILLSIPRCLKTWTLTHGNQTHKRLMHKTRIQFIFHILCSYKKHHMLMLSELCIVSAGAELQGKPY